MIDIEKAVSFLACPNDEGNLNLSNDLLTCNTCGDKFKILDDDTIDLTPKHKLNWISLKPWKDTSRIIQILQKRDQKTLVKRVIKHWN